MVTTVLKLAKSVKGTTMREIKIVCFLATWVVSLAAKRSARALPLRGSARVSLRETRK